MKGKYWFVLWVLLLLLQVLTSWIMRDRFPEVTLNTAALDADLLQLAEQTNATWQDWDVFPLPGQAGLNPRSREQDLIERESLLLQLKDIEEELYRPDIEMQVADDLELWLKGDRQSQSEYSITQYIRILIDWLQLVVQESEKFSLEKVSLYPDPSGRLPLLAFEFSGNPIAIGRTLLSLPSDRMLWKLGEMDMIQEEGGQAWWIRGSLSFATGPIH
ncbi:MAG: hypothetical protein AB3N64_07860 [Puniceicoccaceae bacterium]